MTDQASLLTPHQEASIDAAGVSARDHHATANRVAVSVIVPLYNEREVVPSLVASLARLEQAFADRYDFEFLLVDDGSVDETVALLEAALADRPHCLLIRHGQNRGIGAAIQTGLRAATHEVTASMDCDGSYDPALLGELIPLLAPGVDLVTASPYHTAGAVENVPLWRLRLSRLASQLYGVVCWHKLSCYTSCFRVYRTAAVAPLEVRNEGFVGVAELLCRVLASGGRVVEHPAMLRSRVAGTSKMRVMRASLGHLRLMIRLAAKRVAKKFGIASHPTRDAAPRSASSAIPSPKGAPVNSQGRQPLVTVDVSEGSPGGAMVSLQPPSHHRPSGAPERVSVHEPGARAPGY
jgi:dolichol-phosphate mannosyltransferase